MGLKDDIYNALTKNLGEENVTATSNSQGKIDTLAQDLTDSIITFIQAQEFTVTSLNATQVATTTAPGAAVGVPPGTPLLIPPITIPKITVKIDENSAAPDNPLSGVESLSSVVKLKNVKDA
tara:strand:+ start:366 stop:731 length:366 start_codon:yes stop_codon:yes gene_type:complete